MRFAHVGTRARMINVGLFIQKQNKMEIFQFVSAVCGYHIYKDIWEPSVGEKRIAHREFGSQFNKFAIKVLNGEETVGHLACEYSRIAWYFLARGGSITLEVTGHCRHCKQLCGGMEIPCCDTFSCSRKATINCLIDLLRKKVERQEM